MTAVALTEPAGQKCPAAQLPLHKGPVAPSTAPNRPAGHDVHTAAPAREYSPGLHMAAVGAVDPAAHAYPALHSPLHRGSDRPATAPNSPAAHAAVQLADDSRVVLPKRPGGQSVHTPAPGKL
jgi:hypothetical protein